jgi:DMSO reductase anchor subunit
MFGVPHLIVGILALAAIAGAFALKILYWRKVKDGPMDRSITTTAGATGLGDGGLVRMLDPPHTQTNYLLEEMGFQIARKHARRLRMLALALGLFAPLIFTLVTLALTGWAAAATAFCALIFGLVGVLIERWLFFAEAEHTVTLYYGGSGTLAQQKLSVPAVSAKAARQESSAPSTKTHTLKRRRAPMNPRRRATLKSQQS